MAKIFASLPSSAFQLFQISGLQYIPNVSLHKSVNRTSRKAALPAKDLKKPKLQGGGRAGE